jgi:Protein of unknwon function (DUF3310)
MSIKDDFEWDEEGVRDTPRSRRLFKKMSHCEHFVPMDSDCPVCGRQEAVNNPKHYKNHPSGIEAILITEHMNFCLGNVMKYVWRADSKNGLEDLKKAAWYLDREIKRRENAEV